MSAGLILLTALALVCLAMSQRQLEGFGRRVAALAGATVAFGTILGLTVVLLAVLMGPGR